MGGSCCGASTPAEILPARGRYPPILYKECNTLRCRVERMVALRRTYTLEFLSRSIVWLILASLVIVNVLAIRARLVKTSRLIDLVCSG